jgi:hypothetical protein
MKRIVFSVFLLLALTGANLFAQFTFERVDPPTVHWTIQPPGPDTMMIKNHAYINNTTGSSIVVNITISNVSYTNGWGPAGMCTWETCYPESLYVIPPQTCAPGRDTLYVYFFPHFTPGSGNCRVTVNYQSTSAFLDFGLSADPIGIRQISSVVKDFSLGQNYPNPFNPSTKINFSIPKSEFVYLRVYDILGREVKTLISEQLSAGEYQTDFDAKELASGFYYYSLRAGDNVSVKKMVLVK